MTGTTNKRLAGFFFFGRLLSPLYSYLMVMRSLFYRNGIFTQHKLDVPVISVGNLLMGGTGKTPLVQYIARLLQQHHFKPAVLSRGYKGTAAQPVNVVSDRTSILLDAAEAGDEPRLLAEKLPGVPVITGRKRFVSGQFAIDTYGVDTLILDDGFQHLALVRDLDLVLFSARRRMGNGRVLPGGEMREPLSALKRADAFIVTDVDFPVGSETKEFISLLEKLYPNIPLFTGTYQPAEKLTLVHEGRIANIPQVEAARMPLFAFCGIARPESFKNTLLSVNMNLTGFQAFDDHHAYSAENIRSLLDSAEKTGAQGLITTEKDLVKLRDIIPGEFPLLALPVQMRFHKEFDRFILKHLPGDLDGE